MINHEPSFMAAVVAPAAMSDDCCSADWVRNNGMPLRREYLWNFTNELKSWALVFSAKKVES